MPVKDSALLAVYLLVSLAITNITKNKLFVR